jgi:hypothetical protein
MKKIIAAIALALAGLAHADEALVEAIAGSAVDCVSTGAALTFGTDALKEGNTLLGALGTCAVKPVVLYIANQRPEPERTYMLHSQAAIATGAGVNNALLWLGPKAGIAISGPAAIGIGLAVAAALWMRGSEEREFMRVCAAMRQSNPNLTCKYTRH